MIELSGVTKSFGSKQVLRGIDLRLDKGQSLVVIGGSGTGKSVLLKCILGLVRPDEGLITLEGQNVLTAEREAFLARFGMLFQGGALFDSLRVWENVAFRLMRGPLKRPKDEAREIAVEKLRRNYAGWDTKVTDKSRPALDKLTARLRVAAREATPQELTEILREWLTFFDDGHVGIAPVVAPASALATADRRGGAGGRGDLGGGDAVGLARVGQGRP